MHLVRIFVLCVSGTPEAKTSQNTVVFARNLTGFVPHSSKTFEIWDPINVVSILPEIKFPPSSTQTGVHSGCRGVGWFECDKRPYKPPVYSYLRFDGPFPTGSNDTAPTFCLPFGRIGARRPGIAASTGSDTDAKSQAGNLVTRYSACWTFVSSWFMVGACR